MITAYALLLDRCGLSHREAAELHGVRLDTVRSWASARNRTPPGVMTELRTLHAQIEAAAAQALAVIAQAPAEAEIELGLASDDAEARALGLPAVGAHAALLGLVVAQTDRAVRIVPRGSTSGSAAAADAHGR